MSNNNTISICSMPAGFIVLPSHYLFCSLHTSCFMVLLQYPRASATPQDASYRGKKFLESAVLNLFNPDNKNIFDCSHSSARQSCALLRLRGNHKGHPHLFSLVWKFGKYIFTRIVLTFAFSISVFEIQLCSIATEYTVCRENTNHPLCSTLTISLCSPSGTIFLAIQPLGAREHWLR